jgi:hypothetical protein
MATAKGFSHSNLIDAAVYFEGVLALLGWFRAPRLVAPAPAMFSCPFSRQDSFMRSEAPKAVASGILLLSLAAIPNPVAGRRRIPFADAGNEAESAASESDQLSRHYVLKTQPEEITDESACTVDSHRQRRSQRGGIGASRRRQRAKVECRDRPGRQAEHRRHRLG